MFATICPKEQQTSDNRLLKTTVLSSKYLISAALVVSVGGILRGCSSHLNEVQKE